MPDQYTDHETRLKSLESWRYEMTHQLTSALNQNAKDNQTIIADVRKLDYSINSQEKDRPGLRMEVRSLQTVERVHLWIYRTAGAVLIAGAAGTAWGIVQYVIKHAST